MKENWHQWPEIVAYEEMSENNNQRRKSISGERESVSSASKSNVMASKIPKGRHDSEEKRNIWQRTGSMKEGISGRRRGNGEISGSVAGIGDGISRWRNGVTKA